MLVSKALGHARPSTTLDHYASVISEDLEQGLSLDPLEGALSRGPGEEGAQVWLSPPVRGSAPPAIRASPRPG